MLYETIVVTPVLYCVPRIASASFLACSVPIFLPKAGFYFNVINLAHCISTYPLQRSMSVFVIFCIFAVIKMWTDSFRPSRFKIFVFKEEKTI